MVDREKVIRGLEICIRVQDNEKCPDECPYRKDICYGTVGLMADALSLLKAQEPDKSKYEYHIGHTDCLWYISGEESKCPVTCSQYRDGWNDAMDYIYKDGNGYRPYKRR